MIVYVSVSKDALAQVKTKEQERYMRQALLESALYFRPATLTEDKP